MITLKTKPPDLQDPLLQKILDHAKKGWDLEVEVNDIFLMRIRTAIVNGELDHNSVKIIHPDESETLIDSYGKFNRWPPRLFEESLYLYSEFLRKRQEKRRREGLCIGCIGGHLQGCPEWTVPQSD